MTDDATGYTAAPRRYTATEDGRETCDRMRDFLGDEGFAAACQSNVIKYSDRAGRKGDWLEDMAKAWWWVRMYLHVRGETNDPRSGREGFVGYSRALTYRRNCHNCVHTVDLGDDCYDCAVYDGAKIFRWLRSVLADCEEMPPRDADGCPGFAPK